MKTLDQIIAELTPDEQAAIKRRTLELIKEQLGPELELEVIAPCKPPR